MTPAAAAVARLAWMPLLAAVAACAPRVAENRAPVRRDAFAVWSTYEGILDARRVETIMSRFSGNATVTALAPEGSAVREGDVLVAFDDTTLRRDLVKLERDAALAKAELDSLERAKLPLELRELEANWIEAQSDLRAEQQYLDDTAELMRDGLVSEPEVEQQRQKVAQLKARLAQAETQKTLTLQYLHPLQLDRARATMDAARQELALARQQLSNCVVRAPAAGMVVYRPLHLGADYRTVRVGDSLYLNQPFMAIPDMTDVVVECNVPESELSRVREGGAVEIVSLAYPDLKLHGTIESVGSMATALPGRSSWQKYFRLVIAVRAGDPRLRSGMSVQARVLTYLNTRALLVPRAAVWWDGGKPRCRVAGLAGRSEARAVTLGQANTTDYEVLAGLREGENVLVP